MTSGPSKQLNVSSLDGFAIGEQANIVVKNLLDIYYENPKTPSRGWNLLDIYYENPKTSSLTPPSRWCLWILMESLDSHNKYQVSS